MAKDGVETVETAGDVGQVVGLGRVGSDLRGQELPREDELLGDLGEEAGGYGRVRGGEAGDEGLEFSQFSLQNLVSLRHVCERRVRAVGSCVCFFGVSFSVIFGGKFFF